MSFKSENFVDERTDGRNYDWTNIETGCEDGPKNNETIAKSNGLSLSL